MGGGRVDADRGGRGLERGNGIGKFDGLGDGLGFLFEIGGGGIRRAQLERKMILGIVVWKEDETVTCNGMLRKGVEGWRGFAMAKLPTTYSSISLGN